MLEDKERSAFNVTEWDEKYKDEQGRKGAWETERQKCERVMTNDLPLSKELTAHPEYSDQYFIDNWVQRSVIWKTGALIGSDLFIDLKSFDGQQTEDLRLAEAEVNFIANAYDYLPRLKEVIRDWFITGLGCVKTGWDTEDLDHYFQTGKPTLHRVKSKDIYYRALSDNPRELEYIFQRSIVSKFALGEMYPEKKDEIYNHARMHSREKDKVEVVTIQYRRRQRIQKVEVVDERASRDSGEKISWIHTKLEADEIRKTGEFEDITFEEPFWVSEVHWYQAIYIAGTDIILEHPKYIGNKTTYHILTGNENENMQYPVGMVYYCADILDISIILMTLLTIQVAKFNRPMPTVEEDSLDNFEDFLQNYYKLNYVAKISKEWREKNPNGRPIQWEVPPTQADMPLALHRIISEAIKNQTGAVDAARGEMQYSGQSGVLAYQLQQASQTFVKEDVLAWTDFIKSIFSAVKDDITVYRNYPHSIQGVDATGLVRPLDVATSEHNMLRADRYYVTPIIRINPEAQNQRRRQDAVQTYTAGALSVKDLLEELYEDADIKYNRWLAERGLLRIAQAIETYPELQDTINQLIEQTVQGNVEGQPRGGTNE